MKSAPAATVLYRGTRALRTRAEILASAADLASADGMEALSIGRLARELRMSKTGIFAHFGSKQELQLATVAAAKEVFLAQVVKPSLAATRGLPRLTAMLENWLRYVERIVFRGGCFFAAASLEFDSRPGPVRAEVAALCSAWLGALRDEIAFAQRQLQMSSVEAPSQLAFELHSYVQEANWAFKLFDQKKAFSFARKAIAARLASAVRRHPKHAKKGTKK